MPVVSLRVVIGSEQFGNETVVVVLEWTVENGAFNRLNVVPQAKTVESLGPSSRQLMLSYNTSYNISAVASLCGQYSSHSIELHYGELLKLCVGQILSVKCTMPCAQHNPVKCISPLRLLTDANKQLVIVDYTHPAIEGTIAVFSCSSSGYQLTGPRSAICMGNGEWVPDPRQVQCEGKSQCRHHHILM